MQNETVFENLISVHTNEPLRLVLESEQQISSSIRAGQLRHVQNVEEVGEIATKTAEGFKKAFSK